MGTHSVASALSEGVPARAVFVAAESSSAVPESITHAAALRGVPVRKAPRRDLDRWSEGAAHQGVALEVAEYGYVGLERLLPPVTGASPPLLVALDGVTDPRNVGAVARSALAFGAHGLLLPERRSAGVSPAAWKTSAGALAVLPVARVVNLTRALRRCQQEGLTVLGLAGGASQALYDVDRGLLTDGVCLVVGSEDTGMSRLVSETCDMIVAVPVDERTESLNVSVAAALALSEVARARRAERAERAQQPDSG